MQITANFEGDYGSLIRFVNLIDKSNRLLIMESLNATPQQGATKLNVMMRLDMYVREDGPRHGRRLLRRRRRAPRRRRSAR
jgi:hypothetical protein